MKCEICGSKKDVKAFYGYIANRYYTECRQCFDLACKTMTEKQKKEVWKTGKNRI